MLGSLFVYGSFAQGMVHFNRISSYILEATPVTTVGCVYRLPVGFPVFMKSGFCQVPGTLLRLDRPEALFPILDEFHGVSIVDPAVGLFNRCEIVVSASGTTSGVDADLIDQRAYVYALNGDRLPQGAKLIDGGDWIKSLQENPPLPARLTEKQKTYLRRLAASSGRDIVPIDLTLYRELVHLDLVVDKGRRLALTSLGQEVCRYLV